MKEEKKQEYFITRYSLIPDIQIDIDTISGITKEAKFLDWIMTFQHERSKEINYRGTNYAIYCRQISENCFFMSFAKELHDIIGKKTDDGIIDTPVENYKKCNILVNVSNQWMVIEKNIDISQQIEAQKISLRM